MWMLSERRWSVGSFPPGLFCLFVKRDRGRPRLPAPYSAPDGALSRKPISLCVFWAFAPTNSTVFCLFVCLFVCLFFNIKTQYTITLCTMLKVTYVFCFNLQGISYIGDIITVFYTRRKSELGKWVPCPTSPVTEYQNSVNSMLSTTMKCQSLQRKMWRNNLEIYS